jgi:hypothetical protein
MSPSFQRISPPAPEITAVDQPVQTSTPRMKAGNAKISEAKKAGHWSGNQQSTHSRQRTGKRHER